MHRNAVALGTVVWLALGAGALWASRVDPSAYTGSDRCAACHDANYAGWKETFHATVIQDARANPSAILGDFSVPDLGFSIADVDFTIGGHWDQRYMTKIGDDYYVLPKLWSVQSRSWRPYNVWAWKKKPYSQFCKGCHVTAYDPSVEGTPVEHRVGCEACHGPGRAHSENPSAGLIVNPSKLPEDRRDMICAACHVRGRDPTGKYYFPIGFKPGENLALYYVPEDRTQDETNAQAIARKVEEWKTERSSGAKSRCEVCGITGAASGDKQAGPLDFCFGCHGFKDKYTEHTRHPATVDLVCFDCHLQQTQELMNQERKNIHSYGYFLVHPDQCYDRRIEKTCAKCHADKSVEWARAVVERWRGPPQADH